MSIPHHQRGSAAALNFSAYRLTRWRQTANPGAIPPVFAKPGQQQGKASLVTGKLRFSPFPSFRKLASACAALLLAGALPLFGQTAKEWDKTLGGSAAEAAQTMQQTADGGYILGGYSFSGISGEKTEALKGVNDFWVVKLNADGSKAWDKTLGGSGSDNLTALQQTSDGGYILGGISNSTISGDKSEASKGGNDFWVVKLNADGSKAWDKTIGGSAGDNLYALQQTSDGGYILGGTSSSGIGGDKSQACQGETDYWVVRLQADGSIAWDKTFGGSAMENLTCLQQTQEGGFIVGGSSKSGLSGDKSQAPQGQEDYWVVKLLADGSKEWDRSFGGGSGDRLFSLQQTSDGGYILGGDTYSSAGNGRDLSQGTNGGSDYWLVKLHADGSKAWDKTFGGTDTDVFKKVLQTPDGGYLLAGSSNSGKSGDKSETSKGGNDYWILRVLANGLKAWDKTLGGAGEEGLGSLLLTADQGFLLGGFSSSGISGDKTQGSRGDKDFWVLKGVAGNSAPVASGQQIFMNSGQDQQIQLSAGDADGDPLTYVVVQPPAFGSLSGTAPNLVYTPTSGYVGPDAFTFTAQDGSTTSAPVTVSISVHQPAVHRINAGGPLANNATGVFAADHSFSPAPGQTASTALGVDFTLDDNMYKTERSSDVDNGSFSYDLPVENGQYTLVLHFNEFYWTSPGQRVFDVKAEGTLVLDNYDIYVKAGGSYRAVSESVVIQVADGRLNLSFSALASEGGINRPKVSAIEVIPVGEFNKFPVANAGADQIITLPENSAVLQGAGTDTDGAISSYAWQQVSGPNTATFSSTAQAKPTVSGLVEGTYLFTLSVQDDQQASSAPDQVTVLVRPNQLPVANAGPDQTISLPLNSVVLAGSATDTDGSISSYAWTQVSGPNTATFSSVSAARPSVSGMIAGTYLFSLSVQDDKQDFGAADQVMVVVLPNQVPVANAGEDRILTLPANQVSLYGSGTDADGTISSYAWTQISGPSTAVFNSTAIATPTVSGLTAGTYVFSLTVQDNGQETSIADEVAVKVNLMPAQRINAGGAQLSSASGVFKADAYFAPAPGFTYGSTMPVAGTQDPQLYQTERAAPADHGSFSYTIPMPNWQYRVVLHFAELYWSAPGQRVFDVSMEGALVIDDYDIVKKAGANFTATTETLLVDLKDGKLNLDFSAQASTGGVDRPKISAIEIIPIDGANQFPVAQAGADISLTLPLNSTDLAGGGTDADGSISGYVWQQVSGPTAATFSSLATASPTVSGLVAGTYVFGLAVKDDQMAMSAVDQVSVTVNSDPTQMGATYRINAGGSQVNNSIGRFQDDYYHSNGIGESWNRTIHSTTNAIAATEDDAIYQSDRVSNYNNGSFSYDFPVANGSYRVVLHFAELYWTSPGQRVFDVAMEEVKMLDNYDIVREAGANFTATSESFLTEVADGKLKIYFSAAAADGGVDRPTISAIEVIPVSGTNNLPVADAGPDQTISLPLNTVALQGSGSDPDGTVSSYAWTQTSGPNAAVFSSFSEAAPSLSGLVAGTYVFSLRVKDDQLGQSPADLVTVTVQPNPDAPLTAATYRINAGGGQVVNTLGTFAADVYFAPSPGYAYSSTTPIAGTNNGLMYQTERASATDNGSFSYGLPLSNGAYTVVLHFAELYWNAPGQRVFDVALEGNLVLDNYDIVQQAGANFTATTESFQVQVSDGMLNMLFSALASEGGINRPKVSAIEVIPYTPEAQLRLVLDGKKSGAQRPLETEIQAYPNPFRQEIKLQLGGAPAGDYTVRVLDLLGKEVYRSRLQVKAAPGQVHTLRLQEASLSSGGLYLVSLEQAGGTVRQVFKMMKE